MTVRHVLSFFFFFNDTATTEIYTLSLHDALPISLQLLRCLQKNLGRLGWLHSHELCRRKEGFNIDRKSTRLNSSHDQISYAVFCLKKKKNKKPRINTTITSELHPRLCHHVTHETR